MNRFTKTLLIGLLATLCINLTAQEAKKAAPAEDWDFFGLVFCPNVPSNSNMSNVYGLKVGAPISAGTGSVVCGVEVGVFCSLTDQVYGIQTSPLFCVSDRVSGLQASPVNVAEEVDGLQFGLVNVSKKANFQLGLVNYIKDAACPFLPIFNMRF